MERWINKKSGVVYVVTQGTAHMKTFEGWKLCVIYKQLNDNKTYVRELLDFQDKFKLYDGN